MRVCVRQTCFYFCGCICLLLDPIPVIWLAKSNHQILFCLTTLLFSHPLCVCVCVLAFLRILRLSASNFAFNFIAVKVTGIFFRRAQLLFIISNLCLVVLALECVCVFVVDVCARAYIVISSCTSIQSAYKVNYCEGNQMMMMYFSFFFTFLSFSFSSKFTIYFI